MAAPDLRLSLLSSEFVISAGSVLFKIADGQIFACLLHQPAKDEWVLPKGRKDAGESVDIAAVRETYEETGYNCELFPVTMPTRAPVPGSLLGNVTRTVIDCTEPIAITIRSTGGVTKLTFWYITRLKEIVKREGTQMENEAFQSYFWPKDEALKKLTFEDDRNVLARAFELILLPNLHPVSSAYGPAELFSPLVPTDLEWTCAGGFATETQTFYQILDDGRFMMCQIIHSSTGLWYPTVQFTFKLYNPSTKETIWRSTTVNNFVTPPPGQDKRSCKSDSFSVVYRPTSSDATHSENYMITAKLSDDISILLTVSRPNDASGVKIGKSPHGGFTYFGTNKDKADGYVVHRFWPQTKVTGHLTLGTPGSAASGGTAHIEEFRGHGMLVHAIQGMRPNLVASRWNF
ncbi:putative cell survival pathways protein, partial [Serendipita sp. 399]